MMETLRRLAILAASAAALASCGGAVPPPADVEADKAAVEAVSTAWKQAYNASDVAAVVALYGQDAVLAAPGARALRGKASINDYFARTVAEFSASGLTVEDEPMGEVIASGDLAWQWKAYRVTNQAGAVVDEGKLVTLFQRQDGKWLILGDTWNSDSVK